MGHAVLINKFKKNPTCKAGDSGSNADLGGDMFLFETIIYDLEMISLKVGFSLTKSYCKVLFIQ